MFVCLFVRLSVQLLAELEARVEREAVGLRQALGLCDLSFTMSVRDRGSRTTSLATFGVISGVITAMVGVRAT